MINFTFHGIGGDYITTSKQAHEELLAYLAAHRDVYWTDTFINIMKYVKARRRGRRGREALMTIRTAAPADAEAISAIYAPIVRDTTISFELEPPSVAEMRSRIVTDDESPSMARLGR